jgi:hypothetical protein
MYYNVHGWNLGLGRMENYVKNVRVSELDKTPSVKSNEMKHPHVLANCGNELHLYKPK